MSFRFIHRPERTDRKNPVFLPKPRSPVIFSDRESSTVGGTLTSPGELVFFRPDDRGRRDHRRRLGFDLLVIVDTEVNSNGVEDVPDSFEHPEMHLFRTDRRVTEPSGLERFLGEEGSHFQTVLDVEEVTRRAAVIPTVLVGNDLPALPDIYWNREDWILDCNNIRHSS